MRFMGVILGKWPGHRVDQADAIGGNGGAIDHTIRQTPTIATMEKEHDMPASVVWLGYGGLLPFFGLAGLIYADSSASAVWLQGLLAYGAVILSFVGALHWALAMVLPALSSTERRNRYTWSVVPALVGWLACWSAHPHAAWALVVTFALHWALDRQFALSAGLPAWYLRLRVHLTLGACAALVAGWIGAV
jgi:hypothetical protein